MSSSKLGHRVFVDATHGFALADTGQAQYPAATRDGGRTWRTDGPALHLDAAQAPLTVSGIGAANRRTIYAFGGGQVVDATGDGGRHWYRAVLGDLGGRDRTRAVRGSRRVHEHGTFSTEFFSDNCGRFWIFPYGGL